MDDEEPIIDLQSDQYFMGQALRLAEGNKSAAPDQHKRPQEDEQQSCHELSHMSSF